MDAEANAALRAALRAAPVQPLQWPTDERNACFLVDDKVVALIEGEFLFAAGVRDNVDEYLDELATPGRIEWQ
jgi:hypothetical protein